ncbi:FUSC family protein [Pseudarthrobacter phenanthrenivorans]|uniref:FUSC family protein n=1 Tax=Pseudarthrobacter phenanthrenivorans TaxID=361575 RepID=A0A3B0FSU2_PSEPS|nr:FUSC family protein [Pseudarthrobacter phenanthrenivorans]RKO22885.1 FUSC family protein [Pseudarthrobacter phenanthrenivorans]
MKMLAEMFRLAPGNKDHHPALRCAIGVFVPLFALVLMGRLDLAIFASFGAFTGIYGRGEPHAIRFVLQLRAGVLMLLVIFLAALAARAGAAWGLGAEPTTWLLVLATTLVAGGCSVAIAWLRLRPAGSLFHIFAFAAIASIPNQPPLWEGLLVSVLTTVFCLLVGFSSRVLPSRRTAWVRPRPIRRTPEEKRAAWLEGFGYLVAAGLAGALATWAGIRLGFGHNYWAMVAAVVPLVGHTTRHRVRRGVQRIIGTILGLVVMAAILLLGLQPWQTVVVMALCQFGAELFIIRQYLLAQVFVTPLALVSTLLVVPSSPGLLLRDRIIETVIGAAVGIAVVLAPDAWRRLRGRTTAAGGSVPGPPQVPQR